MDGRGQEGQHSGERDRSSRVAHRRARDRAAHHGCIPGRTPDYIGRCTSPVARPASAWPGMAGHDAATYIRQLSALADSSTPAAGRHVRHSLSLITLAIVATACARQASQGITPVRLDTVAVAAARAGMPNTGTAGAFDAMRDDPFFTTNRIDWPGPNDFRSASGMPGPRYWQQRADYRLEATLDTAAQSVSGSVSIRYTNNSPDTLRFVWLQLDQNLYRPGSLGSALFPADSRWGVRGFEGGFTLEGLTVDGRAPAGSEVRDTRMRVDLERPIAPGGGTATIAMRFRFRVP